MRPTVIGLLFLSGCGHSAVDEATLRDLRARLELAERGHGEVLRKLEELDNRVFLLTDQVESQKMALGRRGGELRLPVISLAPAEERDPPPQEGDLSAEAAPEPPPPPETISEGPRRVLRLEGRATPWLADRSRTLPAGVTATRAPSPGHAEVDSLPPGVRSLGVPKGSRSSEPRTDSAGEPTALYRAAYDTLMGGRAEAAADDFRAFVKRFPRHDLADNAQYWLAETYYTRNAFREAVPEFESVIRRWPSGNKAPDALLKLGYSLLALGEAERGRAVLAQVTDHYPRTDAADKAAKRLDELQPEKKK